MNEKYPYSILFVEDEKPIRQNYVTYLKLLFKNVYEAGDGEEGYAIYKQKKPDIMIVDINMPKMNGLQLLEKIRKNDHQTKAVMLTAHTDTDFLLKASALKLNSYLTKPIDRNALKQTLHETVKELQKYTIQKKDIIDLKQNYSWDIANEILYRFNEEVALTPKEKKLLSLLLSTLSKTFTYEEISIYVWGYEETGSQDSIKTLVKKIRKKLPDGLIKNVFGTGFKINLS